MEYQKFAQFPFPTEEYEEEMKKNLFNILLILLKLYENYPSEKDLIFDLRNFSDEIVRISYFDEESRKWRKNEFWYREKRFAILINSYLLLAKVYKFGEEITLDDFKRRVANMDKIFYTQLLGAQSKIIYESEVNQLTKGRNWLTKIFDFEDKCVKPSCVPRKIILGREKISPSDYHVREEVLNKLLEKIK